MGIGMELESSWEVWIGVNRPHGGLESFYYIFGFWVWTDIVDISMSRHWVGHLAIGVTIHKGLCICFMEFVVFTHTREVIREEYARFIVTFFDAIARLSV
jgi:hypothetical protein